MITALGVEFQKTRRRKIGWIIVAAMVLQTVWMSWSATYLDEEDLRQGWMAVFYQFPLLNALMMPLVIAVLASRLCDVEHKGKALRLIHTLMPARRLFDVKFINGGLYLLGVSVFQSLLLLVVGLVLGFGGEVPWGRFAAFFALTLLVSLALYVLQQGLSLIFTNQMIPFIVGLVGSFFGLFSLFFPSGLQKLTPWGYYGVLSFVRMDWNAATRISHYTWSPVDQGGLFILAGMLGVFYLVGRSLFVRKEQ